MNNTPELLRLGDSMASLAASITDLIQAQIKSAIGSENQKHTVHASEVAAARLKPVQKSDGRLLCDIGQAAELLSVSPVSIRRLIQRNRLTRVPNFRKVLISYDELRKFAATSG